MIPLRDVIPSRTTPYVTMTLIALNVLVYAYQFQLGTLGDAFIMHTGLVPATFTWSAVFTSMFVHGGIMHVAGNMLYLWIFGDNVEDQMGHGRFLGFYILCGALAALAQAYTNPNSMVPIVGASGAIAGVMGAYFVFFPRSRIVTLVPPPFITIIEIQALWFLGIWFLGDFLSGVGSLATNVGNSTGGVAFWAHVAGFTAGAGIAWVLRRPERRAVEWWDRVDSGN